MDTRDSKHVAELKDDANQRAQEWIAFLASSDASSDDRARFEHWLNLDDEHRIAYEQAQAIWNGATALQALKHLEPLHQKREARLQGLARWFSKLQALPQWGAALASALIVAFAINSQQAEEPDVHSYQTQTAEKRQLDLADGSSIFMSPETSVAVSYTKTTREISLLKGEAFFEVFHNPQKPFIVTSAHTQVTVLGTSFNVNSNRFGVTVAVQEGKVEVASVDVPGRRNSLKNLVAGQAVKVSHTKGLGHINRIEAEDTNAWMQDVRIYVARPLAEVLEDLSRYCDAELVIVDDQLKAQTVTAVFPMGSAQHILKALETVLPLSVQQVNDKRIELRAKP